MLWRAGRLDLLRPETFTRYFRGFYAKCDTDAKGVNQSREALRFEQTARLFQMIEDAGHPIVAPYGDARARLDRLRREGATRQNLSALQPFLVSLYQQDIQQLATAHSIERVEDVVWAMVTGYEHLYDKRFGFRWWVSWRPTPPA